MGDKEIMPAAAAAAGDDVTEGSQCRDHPYGKNPGGVCAFCLQEKLGKLVSSSNGSTSFFSLPPPPSSSSSSPPSFRSDYGTASASAQPRHRHRLPFLSSAPKTKTSRHHDASLFKRSKSVAPAQPVSPRKKTFWSFLYLASSSSSSSDSGSRNSKKKKKTEIVEVEAAPKVDQDVIFESPTASQASSSSFGRKVVERSRSVGCGSRSFSGDFLERISTGFGDCTLRRVESQRESGKRGSRMAAQPPPLGEEGEERRIKERVKCGGFFGGFGLVSSSASSTFWLSAAAAAVDRGRLDASSSAAAAVRGGGRSRIWGLAFASPRRAVKPESSTARAIATINAAIANGCSINGGSVGDGDCDGNGKVAVGG